MILDIDLLHGCPSCDYGGSEMIHLPLAQGPVVVDHCDACCRRIVRWLTCRDIPSPDRITLYLPWSLPSKKNLTRHARGRVYSPTDTRELTLVGEIRQQFRGPDWPWGDDSVAVRIDVHHEHSQQMHAEVELLRIGPRPAKFSGRRRDLQNQTAIVLDALQRASVFKDDNQVAQLLERRFVRGRLV